MIIRSATDSDINAIAMLHIASWRATYRGIFSDAYLDGPLEKERIACWQQRIKTPAPNGQLILLAEKQTEVQNKLLGFIYIVLKADPVFGTLIDNFHVAPDQKGAGIGTKLLYAGIKWLISQAPNDGVYLFALEQNYNARRFYENLAGKAVEKRQEIWTNNDFKNTVTTIRYIWKNPLALMYTTNIKDKNSSVAKDQNTKIDEKLDQKVDKLVNIIEPNRFRHFKLSKF